MNPPVPHRADVAVQTECARRGSSDATLRACSRVGDFSAVGCGKPDVGPANAPLFGTIPGQQWFSAECTSLPCASVYLTPTESNAWGFPAQNGVYIDAHPSSSQATPFCGRVHFVCVVETYIGEKPESTHSGRLAERSFSSFGPSVSGRLAC